MKDPAALIFIDTWRTSTTEMNAIARAYYMDLILHNFDKGSLPNDLEELANICRVRFSEYEQFKQVYEQVLKHKFVLTENNRLVNPVANEIIRKREAFKDKRSNAGKLSYVLRYFRDKFNMKINDENFIKENINLDFDIKNETKLEQVFKQLIKQKSELYINENENENENINVIEEEKEIENSKKLKKVLFKDFNSIPILSEDEQIYHSIAYAYFQLIGKNMDDLNLPKNSLEKANALEWIKTVRLMIENKEATVQDFRDVRNYLLTPNCWWKGKILSLPAARGEKWLKLVSSMRSDVKGGKLKKPIEQQMKEATDYLQRLENVLNS